MTAAGVALCGYKSEESQPLQGALNFAVTNTIGWPALVMFAIIFFWTPPHTWALAMRYKDDYKAAGVPMLPAVATERQVTRQILIYTWLTVAATLALALAAGWLYTAVAAVAEIGRAHV